jgi:hypothetical protein
VIQPPLVFVDLETVTLDPYGDVIWEVAAILRDPDKANVSKWVWQVRPDVHKLSEFSRPDFEKRFRVEDQYEAALWLPPQDDLDGPGRPMSRTSVADMFASLTHKRHVVGGLRHLADAVLRGEVGTAHGANLALPPARRREPGGGLAVRGRGRPGA